MQTETSTTTHMNKTLGFLFGLFMATDAIYLFGFGSTLFTISEIYSVVLFVYLFATKQIDFGRIRTGVGNSFRFLLVYVVFSGLTAFASFLSVSLMYRYLVGIIVLIISLTALADMITLFEYKDYIINGIEMGLLLNFIFSVIEYIVWNTTRSPFTLLYSLFPQPNFHMNVYNFGAEGLFLEPSHMIHYIASVFPLWIVYRYRFSFKYLALLIIGLYPVAMSGSGTSMVVWMGLLLLLLATKRKWRYVSRGSFFAFCMIAIVLVIVFAFFHESSAINGFIRTIEQYLDQAFTGSRVTDSSNAERFKSMTTAISMAYKYPIGCGWNMAHTLLEQYADLNIATAFNDIIEMTLELGVGVLFYIWFILDSIISLFKIGRKDAKGVAVAMIAIFVMQCMADYAFNPCMMMVFGFARSIIFEARERIEDDEDMLSRV